MGPKPFVRVADLIVYTVTYGTAFSLFFAIPMIVIWLPIYGYIRKHVASVRKASTFAAAVSAGAGMLLMGLIFGLSSDLGGRALGAILPWTPVVMAIAACLTWFAFRSEQFAGGK